MSSAAVANSRRDSEKRVFFCFFVESNRGFDVERMRAAAKQIQGFHDFRSFMKASKEEKTVGFPIRWAYKIRLQCM